MTKIMRLIRNAARLADPAWKPRHRKLGRKRKYRIDAPIGSAEYQRIRKLRIKQQSAV